MTAAKQDGTKVSTLKRRRGSVLDYDPLTGDVPEGLKRGETFIHQNVRVTPAMAANMVAVNAPFNRPVAWAIVDEFAQEMINGEWNRPSPQGFAFSSAGELIDGQTRCYALIKAGKTRPDIYITVPVHHNYDPEIYDIMDRVRRRTAGHGLGSDGFSSGNNLAAVTTMLTRYKARYREDNPVEYPRWAKVKVSPYFIRAFCKADPEIDTCWKLSHALKAQGGMNRTAAAVGLYLLREATDYEPERLKVVSLFAHGVADPVGAHCRPDDPRNVLHRAFRKPRTNRHEYLGLFLKGWEYWITGKSVGVMLWNDGVTRMPDPLVPLDWSQVAPQWERTAA